jgi:penicillin amidase
MRILRVLYRLGGVVTVLALLALSAVGAVVFLCLPADREVAQIPGLSAPVDVAFDGDGVPHIHAATDEDGAAALGWVHARDRLFQMELGRRAASGRISELAGPRALPLDRTMRVLGLRHRAEGEVAALPAPTRTMLDAYARGVNAYVAAHGRWSALQFAVLGRPEPWTPVDSLLWGKTMGMYLSGNWRSELSRAALVGRMPRGEIDQLWPPQDRTPAPSASAGEFRFAGLAGLVDGFMPRFPDPFTLPDRASNEWAVDGAHSTTGAPLLAGDPHLAYTTPGIWYLARVDTPGATLAGAFAPGVPFLVIGRNAHLAWTFTTNGADTQDVFTETVLPDGRYAAPDGPAAFVSRTEHIVVRGAPAVDMVVRETRHGPVVSDIPGLVTPADHIVLAAAMANLQPGDDAATGLLALNRADSVAQAGVAAPQITSPVQNLLVADAKGIGQFTTGRVPVRRAGDGEWPQPGADGAHDWVGWASGDALPHVVDPPSGRIVNTNERVSPPDFPVFMGRDWYGDWRAQRVRELLGSGRVSPEDFARMQVDVTSRFARAILPSLLARPRQDGLAGQAAGLLAGWDGRMAMDLPQPVVFNAWIQRFDTLLLEKHGAESAPSPWADFVAWVLSPAGAAWCGGDCGPLLDQALAEALPPLAAKLGPVPAQWRWGQVHVATFGDPVLPPLSNHIPQPGDDTTIFRGGGRLGELNAVHGPGYRGVYDLAALDNSHFIAAPGQSGNPFTLHARDMIVRWRDGLGVTLGRAALGGGAVATLYP